MKSKDEQIKKALQNHLQNIDDASFTTNIVSQHLSRTKPQRSLSFVNFLALISGLSIVILSIGLIILTRQDFPLIHDNGITETHALIALIISLIFLIYKWLEELVVSKTYLHKMPPI